MTGAGIVIFAVTYVLISARRLSWLPIDRPAAACVVFGALSPAEAFAAVNGPTILPLFGVMVMGAFLALDGVFADAEAARVADRSSPSASFSRRRSPTSSSPSRPGKPVDLICW